MPRVLSSFAAAKGAQPKKSKRLPNSAVPGTWRRGRGPALFPRRDFAAGVLRRRSATGDVAIS